EGLLERDLVERVGGELHALGHHAGAIRLDLDADVVIHDALVGDQDLHRAGVPSGTVGRPGGNRARGGLRILPGAGFFGDWRPITPGAGPGLALPILCAGLPTGSPIRDDTGSQEVTSMVEIGRAVSVLTCG